MGLFLCSQKRHNTRLLVSATFMSQANSSNGQLRRSLKPRHLAMIAIGGSIGTGLFVASGATIAQAGPGGALLSYWFSGVFYDDQSWRNGCLYA